MKKHAFVAAVWSFLFLAGLAAARPMDFKSARQRCTTVVTTIGTVTTTVVSTVTSTVHDTTTVTVTAPPPTTTTAPTTTTTPPPVPAPSGFIRGHSSHGKSTQDLAHLKSAAGLDAYRDDALFENIYGGQGWGYLDGRMSNAKAAGVTTFLVICDYGSTDPATFAAHCAEVARRYGPNGTFWGGPAPLTLMLEVWNEPYMPGTYVDPAVLAAMTAQAVQAVHAVAPTVQVGPNLDYINYKTGADGYAAAFADAYPAGAPKPDFVSGHPYSDPASLCVDTTTGNQKYRFDRILLLRNTLAAKGWNVPMLASEWGWSSTDVGEAKQADCARRGFELLKSWGVIGGFYYTGDRANTNTGDRYSQYGIMRADGTDKPAVAAIGQAQT